MNAQFVILTDKQGDPVAFNVEHIIAVQVPTNGKGAIVSTSRGDADADWSWIVQEDFAEVMAAVNNRADHRADHSLLRKEI